MQTVTVLGNRPVVVLAVVFAGSVPAIAGCSSGDDAAVPAAPVIVDSFPATTPTEPGVPVTTMASDAASASDPGGSDRPSVGSSTVPVIADSGVPGLHSDDEFCRAWSEFAGSFQALALASSSATDPIGAAGAEVAAAAVVVAAVDQLRAELPSELEPERDEFTVELLGPMARRAGRAVEALEDAGLDDDQIDQIRAAWLVALGETGLDDPDISVAVAAPIALALDAAAAAFSASVPPIAQDPTLVTDASTPLTFAYLDRNCPDQGTLGGNDVVDQP